MERDREGLRRSHRHRWRDHPTKRLDKEKGGQYLICKGKENGGRENVTMTERETHNYNGDRARILDSEFCCNGCLFWSQNHMNRCLSVIIFIFIVTSLFLSCCWSWQFSFLWWWRFLRWIYSQYPNWINVEVFSKSIVCEIIWLVTEKHSWSKKFEL